MRRTSKNLETSGKLAEGLKGEGGRDKIEKLNLERISSSLPASSLITKKRNVDPRSTGNKKKKTLLV